ncbi:hypothetical protein BCR41DRAFT_352774, partial [Lobosporangium transversale]
VHIHSSPYIHPTMSMSNTSFQEQEAVTDIVSVQTRTIIFCISAFLVKYARIIISNENERKMCLL